MRQFRLFCWTFSKNNATVEHNISFVNKHRWFSGRMLACHVGGPGSIPGRCNQIFARNIAHNLSIFLNIVNVIFAKFYLKAMWLCGLMDKATDFGSENCRFVSCHDLFRIYSKKFPVLKMEKQGIDPCTLRMLSEYSTIWATSP